MVLSVVTWSILLPVKSVVVILFLLSIIPYLGHNRVCISVEWNWGSPDEESHCGNVNYVIVYFTIYISGNILFCNGICYGKGTVVGTPEKGAIVMVWLPKLARHLHYL